MHVKASTTKRIIGGSSVLTVANGVGRMLSIVTMPILTKALAPEAYGVAALVGTVVALTACIALLGIDMSYARAYFSRSGPAGDDVEHFAWRFALVASLVGGLVAAGFWYVAAEPWFHARPALFPLVALGVLAAIGSTMAQMRARLLLRYRRLAFAIVLSAVIAALTSILTAKNWRHDEMPLLLGLVVGYLAIVAMVGVPRPASLWRPGRLPVAERYELAKIGAAGAVTAPMFWLLSSADRWVLSHYRGPNEVGVYALGSSIGIVGMMINAAITAVWLPEAARVFEEDRVHAGVVLGRLASRLVAALAIIWLAVTAAGTELVLMLADNRFHAGATYIPWIAAGVFFYGCSQIANAGLLLTRKLKWAAVCWALAGVGSVFLNILFIPRFGALGAAQIQGVSFCLTSIGIFCLSQRFFHMKVEWGSLAPVLIGIAVLGLMMAHPWNSRPWQSIALKFPVGVAATALTFRFIAPDWFGRAKHGLRRGTWRAGSAAVRR